MKRFSRAFALPTVLITSLIMLSVLAVAVQVVATSTSTLGAQNYNQMASAAAQAGVAYAQACMANNGNQVTWSNTQPLMPNTDCTGTATTTCTSTSTNAACWVMQNSNVHTSFSVGVPGMSGDGSLLQITSVGSASELRTSDGSVWRTYTQDATQRYASTCLTTAQQTPGWQSATVDQSSIVNTQNNWSGPTTNSIRTLMSSSTLSPGTSWYRKDFTAIVGGTYTLDVMADDRFAIYIDGQPVDDNRTESTSTGVNTMSSVSVNLSTGCHSVTAQVINNGVSSNASWLALSLIPSGSSTPLISTDATWRTTTGATVPFTSSNYYADPSSWIMAKNFGAYSSTSTPWGGTPAVISNWTSTTGATDAEWIGTPDGSDGSTSYGNYPASSYADFLDNQTVTVSSATTVKVYAQFDDVGYIYLDGQQIATGSGWSTLQTTQVTLQPGTHHFGVILGNNTSGSSAFLLAVVRTSDGAVMTESNHNWVTNDSWATNANVPQSLASDYVPVVSPTLVDNATNLILNPSLEQSIGYWNASGYQQINLTGTWAANGTESIQITPNSTDSFLTLPTTATLTAGKEYTVRATVQVPAKLAGPLRSDDGYLGLVAMWGGAIQAQVAAPNVAGVYSLTLSFAIPSGATGMTLRFYDGSSNTSDLINLDAVMVTAGPMQYPYRDGNSSGWTWSGTTNLSTSSGQITVGASS